MDQQQFHVRALLEELGFPSFQGDLDEALRWALVELNLRRKENAELQSRALPKLPETEPEWFDCTYTGSSGQRKGVHRTRSDKIKEQK